MWVDQSVENACCLSDTGERADAAQTPPPSCQRFWVEVAPVLTQFLHGSHCAVPGDHCPPVRDSNWTALCCGTRLGVIGGHVEQ